MRMFIQKNLDFHKVTSLLEIVCGSLCCFRVQMLCMGWERTVIGVQALKRRASSKETLK